MNRNNATQVETPINYNYVSPYDEMIENNEKIMEENLKQYEDDTDDNFDIKTVDDVTDLKKKKEIYSILKEIDEYSFQKDLLNKILSKGNKKDIHQMIYYVFVINIKLNVLVMIGRCNNLLQTKMNQLILIKIFLHLYFILMIVIYI